MLRAVWPEQSLGKELMLHDAKLHYTGCESSVQLNVSFHPIIIIMDDIGAALQ